MRGPRRACGLAAVVLRSGAGGLCFRCWLYAGAARLARGEFDPGPPQTPLPTLGQIGLEPLVDKRGGDLHYHAYGVGSLLAYGRRLGFGLFHPGGDCPACWRGVDRGAGSGI